MSQYWTELQPLKDTTGDTPPTTLCHWSLLSELCHSVIYRPISPFTGPACTSWVYLWGCHGRQCQKPCWNLGRQQPLLSPPSISCPTIQSNQVALTNPCQLLLITFLSSTCLDMASRMASRMASMVKAIPSTFQGLRWGLFFHFPHRKTSNADHGLI